MHNMQRLMAQPNGFEPRTNRDRDRECEGEGVRKKNRKGNQK